MLNVMLLLADVSVVAEGQVNYHNTKRFPYGGRDLDAFLVSLLRQRDIQCSDPQKLKELCARTSNAPSTGPEVCHIRPSKGCEWSLASEDLTEQSEGT